MDFLVQALEKLEKGRAEHMSDKYASAMKHAVADALEEFCRQDGEFAQAVAQGGSFTQCMDAVKKGVKNGSISDMEAFGLAVKFYFPGAGIKVKMTIDLCASVNGGADDDSSGLVIDLSAFF